MNEKEWEGEMSTEFDRRVRDLHEAPLSFDQVRGKAVKIQRKRRAVVAGGVLAAAAVIVPVAVAAANGLGDAAPDPIPAATQTTSATDVATPETPAAPANPGALGVGYLEQRTYHRADGTAFPLPRAYQDATAIADEVFAWRYDERAGQYVVDALSADGGVLNTFEVLGTPVSDRDGELVAFIDAEGTLVVQWAGGETALGSGYDGSTVVTAVTGGPTCEADSDCRVWVDDDSQPGGPSVVTAAGDVQPLGDLVGLGGLSDDGGVAAVTTSVADDLTSCGGVLDVDAQELQVESCDYSFVGVSPDGSHSNVVESYQSGFGAGWAAILDGDGTEVARFTPDGGAITDQAWQDEEHLLVVTHQFDTREWTVVRLGVDGSEEVVAGPLRAPSEAYPFKLG